MRIVTLILRPAGSVWIAGGAATDLPGLPGRHGPAQRALNEMLAAQVANAWLRHARARRFWNHIPAASALSPAADFCGALVLSRA